MTWFRLGTIGALFAGSVYVLLPTALQGDIEAQRAAQAAAVEAPTSKSSANLVVRFAGARDVIDASVPVIERRFDVAGIKVEGVKEKDGELVVNMRAGTSRAAIESLALAPGQVQLFAADAIAPLPEPLPPVPTLAPGDTDVFKALAVTGDAQGHWANVAGAWALSNVPAGIAPLDLKVTGFKSKKLSVDGELPEDTSFAVVAIDGRMVGLGLPTDAGLSWTPLAKRSPTGDSLRDPHAPALLASGALTGSLKVVEDKVETVEKKEIEVAESSVPPWLLSMLPNTAIALGLDLQGGLDLTLQVELDDAVMSQVSRDAAAMRDQAEREKVAFTTIRKDKFEPMVWFEGADQTEIGEFLATRFSGYVVGESDGEGRFSFRMADARVDDVKKNAVEQVLETLRKRVDATGVKEPSIVKKSNGRINVQLPGAVDLQQAIDAIGTTALLEFRMVDPQQDPGVIRDLISAAEDALPEDQWKDDNIVNDWLWETNRLEEDRTILWHYEETPEGMQRIDYSRDGKEGPLLVSSEVVLTGNDVADASVGFDPNNQPYVGLSFKPRGSRVFCDITTNHVKERFAILLDNQIRSAPSIREKICGGRASIDMGNSLEALDEANTLALVLRTGSLDAPVSIGEVRQVGASLGQDSIRQGGLASLAGGLIVLVFMGIWYRRAGMIANVALMLNVLLVIASLALFGATLTLPGIAGIALTVGMAVDANIIIFERIREELSMGVHPRKAVDTGFDKGLVAVLDANITTGIAGIVLFSYGTGPIKGFAVTLLIGIVTTLVTALFVTRTLMELVTRSSDARITI